MHQKLVVQRGAELGKSKVLIMLHGRGASAEDILSLSQYLRVEEFTLIAPQATSHSWYPYSFLATQEMNEPWLSGALKVVGEVVGDIGAAGVQHKDIYFLGFSQGACLTLEYTARNANRYGGIVAFTGGLIGDILKKENYTGDFIGTPVFVGTSDPDSHVPVQRVKDSVQIFRDMHADVVEKIYPGMGHTINEDEINRANVVVFDPSRS